ncbi:hypothetical protein MtrunA17_Chr5g0434741 [Medicago truncatula]|uniref:Frigida-LIKE protein n=1 Tax=Medicago truncatula TaxID=3880 RepID=G7K1R7_MEDTR|nr:hypothetical protein MTR_5g078500 [Medicago truncatula]RHN56925.1 hypothetical protein MtrunA17_Chr5g0434741 [Medicago truncatula]
MDVEASDTPKICGGGDDDNVKKEPVSCQDFESSFRTCCSKHDTATLPVKRLFDNSNSLHTVKKSKASPYDDHSKHGDGILSSSTAKKPRKSADESFSSLMKELRLVQNSFKKCKRKRRVEKERLQSVKKDIEECCKELEDKNNQVSRFNEIHDVMKGKVEMTEEELRALSQKVAECTVELQVKEKDLDAMNKLVGEEAEKLESAKKKSMHIISEMKNSCALMKEFESKQKQFKGWVKELESKEKLCQERVEELESKEKHYEEWVKKLDSREKQLEDCMKEFESKEKELEGRMNELDTKEIQLEG